MTVMKELIPRQRSRDPQICSHITMMGKFGNSDEKNPRHRRTTDDTGIHAVKRLPLFVVIWHGSRFGHTLLGYVTNHSTIQAATPLNV